MYILLIKNMIDTIRYGWNIFFSTNQRTIFHHGIQCHNIKRTRQYIPLYIQNS